jgi:NhaP-type Na+/H+ or K+/H+ antiporter
VFLPPLIFEGSFAMRWHVFKRLLGQMMVLACIGVVFCTFLTGLVIRTAIHPSFSWADSILLGAILSATDPVSVVALLKTLGASVKLRTLIEGESLLNDGTAIVLFSICINISRGANVGAGEMIAELFQLSLGGVALGAVWAAATIYAVGRVYNDSLTETTIIVASAFLLFFVAEDLCHVSGVLAVVSLGAGFVWIGNSQVGCTCHPASMFVTILNAVDYPRSGRVCTRVLASLSVLC